MERTTSGGGSGGAVTEVREKGAEIASAAQEQLGAKTSELRSEASFQISEQVNERSTQVGEQVRAMGHALRTGAEQLRSEGKSTPANFAEQAAGRAEELGRYLQSADGDRIMRDVENFARRRPWLMAGAGALAGFVASRLVKASSDRRYEAYRGDGYATSYSSDRRLTSGGVG